MEPEPLPGTALQLSTWDMPIHIIDPPTSIVGDELSAEGDADVSEHSLTTQDDASPPPSPLTMGSPRLTILDPPTRVDDNNQDGEDIPVPNIPPPTPPRPSHRSSRNHPVSIHTVTDSLAPSSNLELPYVRVIDLSPPGSGASNEPGPYRVAQVDSETEAGTDVESGPGVPFGALMSPSPSNVPWSTQPIQYPQYLPVPQAQQGYQIPNIPSAWPWSSQGYPPPLDAQGFQVASNGWDGIIPEVRESYGAERFVVGSSGPQEYSNEVTPPPQSSRRSQWKITRKVKKWMGSITDRPPNPQADEWLAVVIQNRNKQFVYSVHGPNHTPIAKYLPKLPSHWKKPHPSRPSLPCTSLVINDLLKNAPLGSVRLYWNIVQSPKIVLLDLGRQRAACLTEIEMEEPATCPLVQELRVVGVAEDHEWPFPWPFIVKNPEGVTVADVLNKVYANFKEYVGKSELEKLGVWRGERARVMHWMRASKLLQGDPGRSMMRADCMCGNTVFRGLEPHPESGGYLLHLGLG